MGLLKYLMKCTFKKHGKQKKQRFSLLQVWCWTKASSLSLNKTKKRETQALEEKNHHILANTTKAEKNENENEQEEIKKVKSVIHL